VTVRVGRIARPEHARARDEQGTANTRATRQRPLPAVAGRGGRVVRVARGLARLVASATERVAARPR
jgi:formylmethanofuran dehydrogenase subunit A